MMKKMRNGAMRRFRRDADDSELFAMGEKLNEKLMEQKAKFEAKAGNMSCILQELNMINSDMELDLDGMVNSLDDYNVEDEWLVKKLKKSVRLCYAMANAIPAEVLNESP